MRARREGGEKRACRRRRARRAAQAGFTLIELLVVVLMVAILATLATPPMRNARDDRVAFDYARRIEQLLSRTQIRTKGHGAHLFVAAPSGTPNRGRFLLFEAFDGSAPPTGPKPVPGCKTPNQWNDVLAFTPGTISPNARIIDGFDMDIPGVNVDADIRTQYFVNGGVPQAAVVMCVSGDNIWVGRGGSLAAAIADMQAQSLPFTQTLEIVVTRNVGGAPAGLTRRVRKSGSAGALILSQ